MEHTGESYEHAPSDQMARRVRRRRWFWAATAALVVAAAVIAIWPAQNRYRATTTVEVGAPGDGGSVATLEYDAEDVTKSETLSTFIEALKDTETVKVQLHSTASTQDAATRQVMDAAEDVKKTASALVANTASPYERKVSQLDTAEDELARLEENLETQRRDLAAANLDLEGLTKEQFRANALQELEEAQEAGDQDEIERKEATLHAVDAQIAHIADLEARTRSAEDAVTRQAEEVSRQRLEVGTTDKAQATTVNIAPVREEVLEGGRPTGRLSLAAILLVIAIASADALFLTRTKMRLPDPQPRRRGRADEPARAPVPPLVPAPTAPLPAAGNGKAAPPRTPEPVAPVAEPDAPRPDPFRRRRPAAPPQPVEPLPAVASAAAAPVVPGPETPASPSEAPAPTPAQPAAARSVPAAARVQPLTEPAPAQPTPAQPTPVQPTPVQPTRVQPMPVQPVAQPAPPQPVQPVPVQPVAPPAPAAVPAAPVPVEAAATPTPPPAPAPLPPPVPVAEVVRSAAERAERPVPPSLRRRHPRRRQRIAASPLDLPNIEVHLLDREGGLRAVQLRDAGPGTAPQSNGADDAE